jgi:hypothetical protein
MPALAFQGKNSEVFMRGRSIPISPARRVVLDFVRLSRDIPLVAAQRHMRLDRLVQIRAQCVQRPMWFAIFAKAYGLVSRTFPELRRAYVKLPWPQFYEYPVAVALLPVGTDYRGEETVFAVRIKDPGSWSLAEIDRRIRDVKAARSDEVKEFRRLLQIVQLPLPIRAPLQWLFLNIGRLRANYLGTFLIGGVSELGLESQHMISPLSNSLSFGPIASDGDVNVRMYWDHRVMDGAVVARALAELERTLNGAIADELAAMSGATAKHYRE